MRSIEIQIVPRTSDIGNLEVKRALPSRERRSVGSFVFWDQFGPGEVRESEGRAVRPHPHIGLSTISYVFDGSMQHRDSLGNDVVIGPGAVNLMTAGSGIVHSERSTRRRDKVSQSFSVFKAGSPFQYRWKRLTRLYALRSACLTDIHGSGS